MYLLVVNAGVARCETWSIEPAEDGGGAGQLVTRWSDASSTSSLAYPYRSEGSHLHIEGVSRDTQGGPTDAPWSQGISMACQMERTVRRDGDHLDVDGAAWFATVTACQTALAAGERVATDFAWCNAPRQSPSDAERAEGLAALLERLGDGGSLWSLREDVDADGEPTGSLHCDAVTVSSGGTTEAGVIGALERPYLDADGNHGIEGVGFEYDGGDWISFGGTGRRVESADGQTGWTSGMGCVNRSYVNVVDVDTVELGQSWHLTLASCETTRADELERRRWLPVSADGDPDHRIALGNATLPGC